MQAKLEVTNMNNKGYIALSMVLIITAVVISIATTVSLLSIGEAQSGLALSKGEDALLFSEGCMEDALSKTRSNVNYTSGTITRPEGSCTITVSKVSGTWTVTATVVTGPYKRTIQTIFTSSGYGPVLSAGGWSEI